MNNHMFANLHAQWKLHRKGQPMGKQLVHVGDRTDVLITEDTMVLMQTVDIPGAIPHEWMVGIGTVTSMALTLDGLLQLTVVNAEDDGYRLILQIRPDERPEDGAEEAEE